MSGPLFDGPGARPERATEGFELAWSELLERLYVRARGGMVLGLERMCAVLERLGHPERDLPAVHVAGSNGKGSTSAFIAAILGAHGARVGLYTSPHLECLSERFQRVGPEGFGRFARAELLPIFRRIEALAPDFSGLTFFEIVTAAALVAFREGAVEVAVAEAGLGARLDATRCFEAKVSALTRIALEHRAILGDTLEAIAAEKAYVARPERPLFMAPAPPGVVEVVRRHAAEIEAPLFVAGRDFRAEEMGEPGRYRFVLLERTVSDLRLGLAGPHQVENALLAAQAALAFEPGLDDHALRRGLREVRWPGRLERFERAGHPSVLLDGAHNPDGARTLRQALAADGTLAGGPLHGVVGVLEDKDPSGMFEILCDPLASLALTGLDTPRALAAEALRPHLPARFAGSVGCHAAPAQALSSALERARADGGSVLVAGSLYLVGAVRPWLVANGWRSRLESLPGASGEC